MWRVGLVTLCLGAYCDAFLPTYDIQNYDLKANITYRDTRESDIIRDESDIGHRYTLWPSAERNADTLMPQTGWWTTKPPPMYLNRKDSEEYDPTYHGQRPRAMLCAHRVVPYVLNRPPPRVLEVGDVGFVIFVPLVRER